MYYFPPISMFYRFALTAGLLVLPVASAHAAYQQNYRLQTNVSSSSSSVSSSVEQVMDDEMSSASSGAMQTDEETSSSELRATPIIIKIENTDPVDETELMTRASFAAELVRSMYSPEQIEQCFWSIAPKKPATFTLVFTDVSVDDAYAPEICIAMRDGLVNGYVDGSFHPGLPVTFADASVMLSRAFVLSPYADVDVKNGYREHIRALLVRNAVPVTVTTLTQTVTVGQMQDMVERLQNGITWRPAQTEHALFPPVRFMLPVDSSAPSVTGAASSSDTMSAASVSSRKPTPSSAAVSSEMPTSAASSKKSFWDLF